MRLNEGEWRRSRPSTQETLLPLPYERCVIHSFYSHDHLHFHAIALSLRLAELLPEERFCLAPDSLGSTACLARLDGLALTGVSVGDSLREGEKRREKVGGEGLGSLARKQGRKVVDRDDGEGRSSLESGGVEGQL